MSKLIITAIIVIAGAILVFQSTIIVDEREQVVITQFGKPVGQPITNPGIHFKVPFIQTANVFDKRYLEWDGDPDQIPTRGKKYVEVDTYARWQITDPLQFFKRLKNELGAQSRIDNILEGETRNIVANNYIEEVVRTSNRTPDTIGLSQVELTKDTLVAIEKGRAELQDLILKASNERAADLGIEILDFRFKRINYTDKVRDRVYERMRTERFKIADKIRSEGQGTASEINGEKERDLKKVQSEAFREAQEIKGKGDAQAAAIYAGAYDKNAQSRELYSFMKSMETFEKTFDKETSIIISTDSELYRYLKTMK